MHIRIAHAVAVTPIITRAPCSNAPPVQPFQIPVIIPPFFRARGAATIARARIMFKSIKCTSSSRALVSFAITRA